MSGSSCKLTRKNSSHRNWWKNAWRALRKLQGSGQVQLGGEALHFTLGQDLLDWVEEVKTALKPGEVKQSSDTI